MRRQKSTLKKGARIKDPLEDTTTTTVVSEDVVEVEEAPPARPETPPFLPLEVSVPVFMWLRDRIPSATRIVPVGSSAKPSQSSITPTKRQQPTMKRSDKKSEPTANTPPPKLPPSTVTLPREFVEELFEGSTVVVMVQAMLPRSVTDGKPTFSTEGHHLSHSGASPQSARKHKAPALQPSALSHLSSEQSLTTSGHGFSASPDSSRFPSSMNLQPQKSRLERRCEQWDKVQSLCINHLQIEIPDEAIRQIADECDTSVLVGLLERLCSYTRREEAQRKAHVKALMENGPHPQEVVKLPRRRLPPLSVSPTASKPDEIGGDSTSKSSPVKRRTVGINTTGVCLKFRGSHGECNPSLIDEIEGLLREYRSLAEVKEALQQGLASNSGPSESSVQEKAEAVSPVDDPPPETSTKAVDDSTAEALPNQEKSSAVGSVSSDNPPAVESPPEAVDKEEQAEPVENNVQKSADEEQAPSAEQ